VKRRTLIAALLSGLSAPFAFAQGRLPATPHQFTGPFYPVGEVPLLADLTRHGGLPSQGQAMQLTGRVLDRQGSPVPAARIVFWQSDARGVYRHEKDDRFAEVDPGFAGFGAVDCDVDGGYSLRTILPVPYTGRPPHIHARVWIGGEEALTTQIYLDGQASENNILFRMIASFYGDRSLLTIAPTGDQELLAASFDFVLDA